MTEVIKFSHHVVGTLRDLLSLWSLIVCPVWNFCKYNVVEVHKEGMEFIFSQTAILALFCSQIKTNKFHQIRLLKIVLKPMFFS